MSVDLQLGSDNRLNRSLANEARILAERFMLVGFSARWILEGRHRFDGELRDATEIGAVGDAQMRVPELPCASGESLGRDGAVAEGESGVRPEFREHRTSESTRRNPESQL
jgi:hypothetical protein